MAAVISIAFACFVQFLQSGEVDCAQRLNFTRQVADVFAQGAGVGGRLGQFGQSLKIRFAFAQVFMVALGVDQGFLLLQQRGLGGGLQLRQGGGQLLLARIHFLALALDVGQAVLCADKLLV